jgi:LmbE family N-acetylglucosaminyl deacetylase
LLDFYSIKNLLSNKLLVAIIVAHPDDETLWAGGLILNHPLWEFYIVCLCRKNDNDRAPRFYKALKMLHAKGIMGDLNDGPEQNPIEETDLEQTILDLLPQHHFDLIITHNPKGEYTKHLRHEETSKAVIKLWEDGKIDSSKLWAFAYEDGNRAYYPRAVKNATSYYILGDEVWFKKYHIITDIYGYGKESWEANATPQNEAFLEITKT